MVKRKIVLIILVSGFLLGPVPVVGANAAPPISEVWFTFDYQTGESLDIEGMQLIGCETMRCEEPMLLQQYGVCQDDDCLTRAVTLPDWDKFECQGDRCLSTTDSYGTTRFRLLVQFTDKVRVSGVIDGLPSEWGRIVGWRVKVQPDRLVLIPDPNFRRPVDSYGNFLEWLGFTQVVELLVAGMYLLLWVRISSDTLLDKLIMLFLINLVTYPLVWLFFPSLGPFQPEHIRRLGVFIWFVSIFYTIVLIAIFRTESKVRRRIVTLTLISLPATCFCALVALFIAGYGHTGAGHVVVGGVSPKLTILWAEVFAVTVEAGLVVVLSKGSIPWHQAGAMSLLMNMASFVLGQWIG